MGKKKPSDQLDPKEYEKLGRFLVSVGEIGYKNKKELYKAEFIKGVVRGFGSVVGATIIIAIALFILTLLGSIPLIGDIANSVENTINSSSEAE